MVATKKRKSSKPTTSVKTLSKNESWDYLESTRPEGALKHDATSRAWREKLCNTLIEWAYTPDALSMMDFSIKYKIPRRELNNWRERFEDVRSAYEDAALIVANRRLNGALTKKFDKDVVRWNLHTFDPEWLEINRYQADLKNASEAIRAAFTFIKEGATVQSKEEFEEEIKKIGE